MQNVNYKSDFLHIQKVFITDTKTGNPKDIGFPDFDFTLQYFTVDRNNYYEAGCHYVNGKPVFKNCKNVDGKILVIFNNYKLLPGNLKVEIKCDIPDDLFPDGIKTEIIPCATKVDLVIGPSDSYGLTEATAILPFIQGKDFTFDDFTEDQLQDIIDKVAHKVVDLLEGKDNKEDQDKEEKDEHDPKEELSPVQRLKEAIDRGDKVTVNSYSIFDIAKGAKIK